MKKLMFPDFPREEYAERYARTQRTLRRHGLDALFLTNRENLRYFAGLRDGAWDVPGFYFLAIVPSEGDPVLLVAKGFNHLIKQCWVEDVRYWSWEPDFYLAKESGAVREVVETLREKRLDSGTIGMELSADMHIHMGQQHFGALCQGLPGAKIVDGSSAIWEVRSIKSPAEIDRLRKAADISIQGVTAGFGAMELGMTEKQVMSIMTSTMCAAGASRLHFNALYAGPRRMWADCMPTDYALQPGDMVQFDGGGIYEGYWADFKRIAFLGEPREDQKRFYAIAKEAHFAAIEAIRPGVPFNALLQATYGVYNKAGFVDFTRWCLENGWSSIGHSIGLSMHELPGPSPSNTAPLQENMVLCIEPHISLEGVYPFWEAREKFGMEDIVLVTKEGPDVLTSEDKITHELWIV